MCGSSSNPGLGIYPPPVRWNSTNPSQSAISQWGLEFPYRAGRYRPGGPPFLSPVRWNCRGIEGFMIRGWSLILPWWRWLHDSQPISDQSAGLGVSTSCGAVSTQWTTVFVPGVLEFYCRWVGWFMIPRWDATLSGWRWPHETQPISE